MNYTKKTVSKLNKILRISANYNFIASSFNVLELKREFLICKNISENLNDKDRYFEDMILSGSFNNGMNNIAKINIQEKFDIFQVFAFRLSNQNYFTLNDMYKFLNDIENI